MYGKKINVDFIEEFRTGFMMLNWIWIQNFGIAHYNIKYEEKSTKQKQVLQDKYNFNTNFNFHG